MTHDSAFHDLKVSLSDADRIYALRIDPTTAPGSITIRNLVLRNAKGNVIKKYEFKEANASNR